MHKLYYALYSLILVNFLAIGAVQAQGRIYVNTAASGADNGTSWQNAYSDLQDALAAAAPGDSIWIAAGTYYPTSGTDRDVSFELVNGTAIFGGFDGTETNLDNRNFLTNQTILSGDLNNDDGSGFANTGENSYTVLYGANLNSDTRIDGLIIEGGNASDMTLGTDQNRRRSGGGFFNYGEAGTSIPTVTNCTFQNNQAQAFGAAFYNNGAYNGNTSCSITNCTFINNSCDNAGGALHNDGRVGGQSDPYIYKCTFQDNYARISGGAIFNFGQQGGSSPSIVSCSFISNETLTSSVSYAGAIYNLGIINGNSNPLIINCLFNGNRSFSGGAIYNLGSNGNANPVITNCTFYDNFATTNAGAIYANGGNGPSESGQANVVVTNSIFLDNMGGQFGGDIFRNNYGSVTISFSNVDKDDCSGLNAGPGSDVVCGGGMQYNVDPLFVNSSAGDFQLQSSSPAIDSGDNAAITGFPEDLLCNPRIEVIVDMGAYEYQPGPLPIELMEFEAIFDQNKVHLWWTTLTETDNDFFTIEKSADGRNFEPIEEIEGNGNCFRPIRYQTYDLHPFAGHTYYRLKQTDFDGRFSYSNIRVVNVPDTELTAYPNPVADELFISLGEFQKGEVDYEILDLSGKQLFSGSVQVQNGLEFITVKEVANLQPGSYFITVTNEFNRMQSFKFVKVRM